ncbi:MAG: hypothetical protein ACW98X_27530 [Promethearchaeota archaeon]
MVLLPLVSCSKPTVNVLVVPKNKDAYCIAELVSTDWKDNKTIELYDNNNNMITCKATYRMTKNSLSCDGKEYNAHLTCFNNRQAELNITTTSCTEAYGVAIGDRGDEYDVYIGLSDLAMKDKMAELDKIIIEQDLK